jgi:acetoin utilization protein AcuC
MEGEGFSVNIPLPAGTGDKSYLYAFSQIIPDLIRKYKPEILINQFGADGHFQDPLVGLSLTTKAYQQIASILHKLAHEVCDGRYIILGGGGYVPENVARCWAIAFIEISEAISKADLYRELFDKVERRESEAVVKEVRETVRALRELISLAPADSRSSRDNQRCGKPPKRMR